MYRILPLLLTLALIPGCGVLLDLFGLGDETGSSELKAFESEKELAEYFSDQITARNDRFADIGLLGLRAEEAVGVLGSDEVSSAPQGAAPEAPGSAADGDAVTADTDFSQTTIQEVGVDEADVVKTDGTYVYTISNASGSGLLRIVRISPPEQLAVLGEVPLVGFGREIYLHDGKVVAITETFGLFTTFVGPGIVIDPLLPPDVAISSDPAVDADASGTGVSTSGVSEPGFMAEVQFERPRTIVTVVDVSTPDDPAILSQTKFDGTQASSRMIDGVLHLVISNLQDFYYDVLPMLGQPELDVTAVNTTELLPKFERVDGGEPSAGNTVTWRELYRPTDPDGFGVVTVISLDVDNDAEFTAVGVVAEPGLIYSSLSALYLTDTEFNFSGDTRETTDIYKFAYVDRGAEPRATGSVPGRILNQYSMSEYGGYLRVATTVSPTFSLIGVRTGPHNNVFVLGQSGGALEVVGSVENIAPRETIRSARFVGDRGYVVTFEQIDPLFTLDLSDPTDPRVVGELKVPGFSTFLVPIDADHLLAVGQYIPDGGFFFGSGVQLSIFDVSDFANPTLTANVVLGAESGASSEALFNPKAFTYFADRNLVALPVSIFEDSPFVDVVFGSDDGAVDASEPAPDEEIALIEPFVPQGFDGLVVYSLSVDEGFTELGRISTRFEESGYFGSAFTRGVFIGDDVFAVTDRGVRGAPLANVESAAYKLLFASTAAPR